MRNKLMFFAIFLILLGLPLIAGGYRDASVNIDVDTNTFYNFTHLSNFTDDIGAINIFNETYESTFNLSYESTYNSTYENPTKIHDQDLNTTNDVTFNKLVISSNESSALQVGNGIKGSIKVGDSILSKASGSNWVISAFESDLDDVRQMGASNKRYNKVWATSVDSHNKNYTIRAGGDRMKFTTSGRIGVGTSDPASFFHIASTSSGALQVGDGSTGSIKIGDGTLTKSSGSNWVISSFQPDGDLNREMGANNKRYKKIHAVVMDSSGSNYTIRVNSDNLLAIKTNGNTLIGGSNKNLSVASEVEAGTGFTSSGLAGLDQNITFTDNSLIIHNLEFKGGILVAYSTS